MDFWTDATDWAAGQSDPNRARAIETLALQVFGLQVGLSERPESRPSD